MSKTNFEKHLWYDKKVKEIVKMYKDELLKIINESQDIKHLKAKLEEYETTFPETHIYHGKADGKFGVRV